MKRRTAIRNVILVSAGAAFLHACQYKSSITLKHIALTGSEEDLLSELTEAIIPKTDFLGAKDLKSSDFIFMMADDCMSPEDQTKFSSGMKAFDDKSKEKMGSRFVKLPNDKRKEFLSMIEGDKEGKEIGEDARWFYSVVKQGTIQNFSTSNEFMTEV